MIEPYRNEESAMVVHRFSEDRFSGPRNLLQSKLDSGEELGTSLAVSIDNKLVVDLWGGYQDPAKTRPWQENTIVNLWSTTKAIGSLAALVAVEKGGLGLDEEVYTYWPEFGVNGKQGITMRQVISHTSGVSSFEKPVVMEDSYELDKSTAKLAQQEPWWEPGTASGYHALTHGHLISAILKRAMGKTLTEFVRTELVKPLDADFQLGAVAEDYNRVATIIPPVQPPSLDADNSDNDSGPAPGSVAKRAKDAPFVNPSIANTTGWRAAEVGSGNGHGNSRSVATMLSAIALGGEVNGIKYLSPEMIDQIFQEQAYGQDLMVGLRLRFGTGFGLPAKDTYWDWAPSSGRVCGWGGLGGSMGIADVNRRMTIGYAMNKMWPVGMGSPSTKAYVAGIYRV